MVRNPARGGPAVCQFLLWFWGWLGFAVVSLWTIADHAARLLAVGVIARAMWRARDDDGTMTT
jgi:hypothetical protein